MDVLEYAIKMELEGEQYYREQMEINKNNRLYSVCRILAEDEKRHARILENKRKGLPYELEDKDALAAVRNVFSDEPDFDAEGKAMPSQLDFYRMALGLEKESIELYNNFLTNADSDEEKEIFRYLVEQERQHFRLLDEMVALLRHAEEWVESAEFGIRGDY